MRKNSGDADIVLIGAGIMSATLGMLLKQLQPGLTIQILERLDVAAAESSDAWNNAGTGHSAFCELNYTPELADGSISTAKAVSIAESFDISRQFWSFLIERNLLKLPHSFIRSIPHISFVWGDRNVDFLKRRYDALKTCHLFREMQFSQDPGQIRDWIPLVMEGRDPAGKVAATCVPIGTDVNFGSLTRCMFNQVQEMDGVGVEFNQEVTDLEQDRQSYWHVEVKNRTTGGKRRIKARFVFIGAGGGALPLLLKSGIPEGKGFGGFPVSGQWLKCTNPAIIERHHAKVYGKAAVGSPPMSVPHLDTRFIKGKKELLFGPYAGFTTRFLKNGSLLDLVRSVKLSNIRPMIAAGMANIDLTRYLIEQVRQSPGDRLNALRDFYGDARLEDWELEIAGQRVQVIKKDPKHGGILEFGTEVVSARDGSLAALLGASPGASTAVSIMITLLKKCFPNEMGSAEWQRKLKEMIPSYGQSLGDDPELCARVRNWTSTVLGLYPAEPVHET